MARGYLVLAALLALAGYGGDTNSPSTAGPASVQSEPPTTLPAVEDFEAPPSNGDGEPHEVRRDGTLQGTLSVQAPVMVDHNLVQPVAGGPAYPVNGYFAQVYDQAEATGPASFTISPSHFYMKGEDGEVWRYGDGNRTSMGLPVFSGGTLQPGERATGMVNFDLGAESRWIVYAPEGTPLMQWQYDVAPIR